MFRNEKIWTQSRDILISVIEIKILILNKMNICLKYKNVFETILFNIM